MKNYFTIKQAAEIVGMTAETLRHYDRIGLVAPCCTDESSGYRYYSEQELVRLQIIGLLKNMDLSLGEIGEILRQDDLDRLTALLKQAEQNTDQKIARLQYAKEKIRRARADYEEKSSSRAPEQADFYVCTLPARMVLLSDSLTAPTLKNLWNYLGHFYKQAGPERQKQFLFEDTAGMLTAGGSTRLFAVCLQYPRDIPLTRLPPGPYLCGNCTEETRADTLLMLREQAKRNHGIGEGIAVHKIVVTGILQWKYQIQVYLGEAPNVLHRNTLSKC